MRIEKNNVNNLILTFIAAFLYFFTSCENIDEMMRETRQNATLEVVSDIVKLVDDSTNIAGYVEVSSSAPELELKWNCPPECNVDTTQTTLRTNKGVCKIPVKWAKEKDGTYTSSSIAFDGGVLVSTGNISKYVHLIWADKIDSTEIAKEKEIVTRSEDALPKAVIINLTPEQVNMDIVAGGGVAVEFSGASFVSVDQNLVAVSTNIDKSKIPLFLTEPKIVEFKWMDGIAPNTDFSTKVDFKAGGIIKTCYIYYTIHAEEPLVWEFLNSSIADGNELPATNATVSVTVKTNKPWSIESTIAEISPMPEYGEGIGIKTLTLHIKDNPSPDPRPVSVLVKSQGVLKKTLTFTQQAPNISGKTFEFISSDPVNNATIPSTGTTVTVKVKTDVAWWINLNGSITNFPAGTLGEKTGTITIPASTSTTNQTVTYLIGYDNVIVKSISYTQPAAGSDIEGTLDYESGNLPAGNIPAEGGTYTFTFSGTYTGNVQMRVLLDGVAQTPGSAVTNKQPQVNVPLNAGATRAITFQYKRDDRDWTNLPVSTDRRQDADNGGDNPDGGSISLITISPQGDISEYGAELTASFQGNFNGNIEIRATSEGGTLITASGKVNTSIPLTIPQLFGYNRIIVFEYSLDGGKNWLQIEQRNQINETFGAGMIQPRVSTIPAGGQALTWSFVGTYSRKVTWQAFTMQGVLAEITANGPTLSLIVPKNDTGKSRTVNFMYKLEGRGWVNMESRIQPAE